MNKPIFILDFFSSVKSNKCLQGVILIFFHVMAGKKSVKYAFLIIATMSHFHSLNLKQNGKQMLLTFLGNGKL